QTVSRYGLIQKITGSWRSPVGSASQSHLYISGWFVGFRIKLNLRLPTTQPSDRRPNSGLQYSGLQSRTRRSQLMVKP
ncbi:MAG: hypothetical protein VKL02_05670, partial [Cylindrospermopsis raciborskii 1523720]|uniref:hypothetical protein n=1 Tax=Cylindrospermopsis raciborskii TaxID=77022 RepID=UPI002B45EC38